MTEPLDLEPIKALLADPFLGESAALDQELAAHVPGLVAEVERLRSILDYIDDTYGVASIAYRALQGRSLEEIQKLHENRD